MELQSCLTDETRRALTHVVRHIGSHRPIATLLPALASAGVDEETVKATMEYCHQDPLLSVMVQLAWRVEARDWLCRTLMTVDHDKHAAIALRTETATVADEDFAQNHYFANQPLILRSAACRWPAIQKWTNDYLKTQCGSTAVKIMTGRSGSPVHAQNTAADLATEMSFGQYVDKVEQSGPSNDFYMVARNEFFRKVGSRALLPDLSPRPSWFEQENQGAKTYLWFGPAGTVTPLHFDTRNNMLFQIRGRKHLMIFSPFNAPFLYQQYLYYSAVNCDEPDLRKTPMYGCARGHAITLEPGDALFLPVAWWHHVRSLDVSITVTMTDFRYLNEYGSVSGQS